jgi:hypothetical protein
MKEHKISLSRLNYFTANLNAILLLVGYAFFTSLIFGVSDNLSAAEIRLYSILYRAFALSIAILTIMLNFRVPLLKSSSVKWYFILWFLFSCRIIYDLFLRPSEINPSDTSYFYQYIFGGILIPTLAIYMSHKRLDLRKIYYAVFFILIWVVTKGVIANLDLFSSGFGRVNMNIAQSTLSFGVFGAVLSLLSYSMLAARGFNYKFKIVALIALFLGVFAIGMAGSRGPLFGLVLSILIPFFFKNSYSVIKSILFLSVFTLLFGTVFLELIKNFLPVIYERTYDTVVNFSLGGRESIFIEAVNQIIENPFLGDWFLLDRDDSTSIAHNAFLQAGMSLGVLGIFLNVYLYYILFKYSLRVIRTKSIYSTWGYLTIFFIVYSLTTGGNIYIKPEFNFAFLILLLINSSSNLYHQVNSRYTTIKQ